MFISLDWCIFLCFPPILKVQNINSVCTNLFPTEYDVLKSFGGIWMSFYTNKTANKGLTEAQQQRFLTGLRKDRKSYFANKDTCGQISLRGMPRPKGKVYKD